MLQYNYNKQRGGIKMCETLVINNRLRCFWNRTDRKDNMYTEVCGVENIDILLSVIDENTGTIKSMRKKYKEQEKLINTTMQVYATYKMKFTKEQINAFREYVACINEENNLLHDRMTELNNDEELKDLGKQILTSDKDYEGVFESLNGINRTQIEIMDILCDMIERSQQFMALL